jgi:hypothetical protein
MATFRNAIYALGLALALAGCRIQEYVVARDEVPLYATPACDKVVDMMPLGHHERITDDEAAAGVVRVTFNGRQGYAKKSDLRQISYVHPELDEGQDRESTVGRAVRDVAVEHAGQSWSDDVRDAIRDGRVIEGMTREQVELAWGWPRTIEPLATPVSGERWIYRRHGYETFEGGSMSNRRFRPYRGASTNGWSYRSSGGTYYRMPVVEERVVEFADKKVSRSFVRRYYDVEGSSDDEDGT